MFSRYKLINQTEETVTQVLKQADVEFRMIGFGEVVRFYLMKRNFVGSIVLRNHMNRVDITFHGGENAFSEFHTYVSQVADFKQTWPIHTKEGLLYIKGKVEEWIERGVLESLFEERVKVRSQNLLGEMKERIGEGKAVVLYQKVKEKLEVETEEQLCLKLLDTAWVWKGIQNEYLYLKSPKKQYVIVTK